MCIPAVYFCISPPTPGFLSRLTPIPTSRPLPYLLLLPPSIPLHHLPPRIQNHLIPPLPQDLLSTLLRRRPCPCPCPSPSSSSCLAVFALFPLLVGRDARLQVIPCYEVWLGLLGAVEEGLEVRDGGRGRRWRC